MRTLVIYESMFGNTHAVAVNIAAGRRLVQTAMAGHAIGEALERPPFAEGTRQIQAFYIMDLASMDAALEWANRLPTYGCVEVRELLQF